MSSDSGSGSSEETDGGNMIDAHSGSVEVDTTGLPCTFGANATRNHTEPVFSGDDRRAAEAAQAYA